MSKRIYECSDCLGSGESVCDHCGSDILCKRCRGNGINPEIVDLDAFREAVRAKEQTHRAGSWSIMEDRHEIGRQGGAEIGKPEWQLFYRDFERGNP